MDLYRFRYLDQLTGKWREARYHATKEEIATRYKDFELLGEPEVRELGSTEPFNPFKGRQPVINSDMSKEAVRATAATEPMRFDEAQGRNVCQFCGSHGGHDHEADCVWVACKNAVASWREGNG